MATQHNHSSYNIPKQARNKYNVVKTSNYDVNNIVTTTNLSMSNGGSGGGGGGGITPISHQQVVSAVNQQLYEKGLPKDGTLISYQNVNAYYAKIDDLKTINGYSLIGTGDIEVTGGGTVDLSDYVTKTEINTAGYITSSTLSTLGYVTATELDTKLSSYVTKTEIENSGYITNSTLQTELSSYAKLTDLETYVTKTSLDSTLASYVTLNELSSCGYIDNSTLSQASYVTQSGLATELSSYVTKTELHSCGYIDATDLNTKLEDYAKTEDVDEKLSYYSSNEVHVEDTNSKVVTQDDGIIVLTDTNRASTVTLPINGIEDGKTIYIINKTGQAFTISTSGTLIDKASGSSARASQTLSENVIQMIYYNGEWFVI